MSSVLQSDLVTFALLVVEPFLLIVTLLLLVLNRREQKGRDRLLERLSAATDVVSRQEYFVTVLGSLQSAKDYVVGSVTGSSPNAEESEVLHQVVEAISAATSRGVKVRYLLPLAPDRLQVAQMYSAAGAEVRFNPGVLVADARYMIVDDRSVVVGVPERKGKDEPTRKGYIIPSETVGALFKGDFDSKWGSPETRMYASYLEEVVSNARSSNPAISAELIAANLKIDRGSVDMILSRRR
ncbi:MAG TPA: TrmB family transcriptional regulator sugar-binding domain-containing protein [Nitrososphaerales archaeon]|nr:TrmB family transcriptional regulator sugar-binding domain-containing protein [Nitrososphaerales archaeon]